MNLQRFIKRSPWVFHLNTGGCNACDIEILAALTPRYDAERFGVKLVGSPRHADILVVSGPMSRKDVEKAKRIYEQMPSPKAVVAVGVCTMGGSVFHDSPFVTAPISDHIPVDIYIPGCPPRPEAILHGILEALEKLEVG